MLVKNDKPTLSDIVNSGSAQSSCTPTNPNMLSTSSTTLPPTLDDIIGQSDSTMPPTLGNIIDQNNTAKGLATIPTLGDIISGKSSSINAAVSDSRGYTIGASTTPSVTPSHSTVPTLADIISGTHNSSSAPPGIVNQTPSNEPTLSVSLVLTANVEQDSGSLLKGTSGLPPGFSVTRPLVSDPFALAKLALEDNKISFPVHPQTTDSESDFSSHENEDFSPSVKKITVLCPATSSSMVGVVLANKDHEKYKSSEVIWKRKQIVLRKINRQVFFGKRFNFSTPSPDDYILEKQKKAF